MKKVRSIKQNVESDTLPNFRSLGVSVRILLISHALAISQVIFLAENWKVIPSRMAEMAASFVPILLATLIFLLASQTWLKRFPYWTGAIIIHIGIALITLGIAGLGNETFFPPNPNRSTSFDLARFVLFGQITCSITLMYFRLRGRLLSHAMNEARLQMLRARIRPHFFFNCINAVLGILRAQPKKAETALEDMADLFRMAMADAKDFMPLTQEIQLCTQYLALEQIRMGDRLQIDWQTENLPDDIMIPPLLLQPLLENAVYHGIEPLMHGGRIKVDISIKSNMLDIAVENPCTQKSNKSHAGNKMALQNIRERLELLFDSEAHYQVESGKDFYRVEITMPYLKESSI